MILDAEEARNRAGLNTPAAKLVEKIMEDICKVCDEGKFYLNFWIEDENGDTVRHASKALRSLGYTVIPGDIGESLWIGW